MTLTTNLSSLESTYSEHNIYIYNLYNKLDVSNIPVLDDLTSILSQTAIAANNLPSEVTTNYVIVGDLNINLPSLNCKTTQADNQTPKLVEIINHFNFIQHLSPRTTIYISLIGSDSTIALVFTSARLTRKIQMCDVIEALDYDWDNLLIGTILDLSLENTAPDTRYSYNQTKTKVFKNTLSISLSLTPTTSFAPEMLDKYVTQLINAISN